MTRPTLALCIPAYRAEAHLPRLLATAHQQNPPFDEIVVCVDASPDGTANVALDWGATVLINTDRLGCSRSKNRALEAARCDWVHFHDADDILLPGFTAEAHRWMVMDNPPEVVLMGFEYREFGTNRLLSSGLATDSWLSADPVRYTIRRKVPNFGLYRREPLLRLGGFDCDPAVLHNEDVAFHIRLALAGFRFRASEVLTSINWRHDDTMSSANPVACLLAHHAVMLKVAAATGSSYAPEIAERLWLTAQGLAMYDEWESVERVLADTERIFSGIPSGQSCDFTFLCYLLSPKIAFRVREWLVRVFKAHLRTGLTKMPSTRLVSTLDSCGNR